MPHYITGSNNNNMTRKCLRFMSMKSCGKIAKGMRSIMSDFSQMKKNFYSHHFKLSSIIPSLFDLFGGLFIMCLHPHFFPEYWLELFLLIVGM